MPWSKFVVVALLGILLLGATPANAQIEWKSGVSLSESKTPEELHAALTALSERAGFSSLFSGHGGFVTQDVSPFAIPRMNASSQATLTDLQIDVDRPW